MVPVHGPAVRTSTAHGDHETRGTWNLGVILRYRGFSWFFDLILIGSQHVSQPSHTSQRLSSQAQGLEANLGQPGKPGLPILSFKNLWFESFVIQGSISPASALYNNGNDGRSYKERGVISAAFVFTTIIAAITAASLILAPALSSS